MASKSFMMTLPENVLEQIKQEARKRSVEEKKDYTYQDIIRMIIQDKIK